MSQPISPAAKRAATGLMVALPFLGFFATEALLRLRASRGHGFAQFEELRLEDAELGFARLKPDLHAGPIDSSSLGFRSPELADPKSGVRLAFLGASTTFCAEVSDNAHTWPSLVHAAFAAAHPEKPVDFVNASLPGYRLEQIDKLYRARVAPLEPNVVVYYEATNELSYDTRALAKAQGLELGSENWLSEYSLFARLVDNNLQIAARQRALFEPEGKLRFDASALTARYKQGLVELVAEVKKRGSVVALVTFSPRMRRAMSREALAEAAITASYYMPYLDSDGLLAGYEAYNQAIRDAAKEAGALLIEGEDEVPADALHYVDSVHFSDRGAAAMAERVSKRLLAAPEVRALFEASQP